MEWEREGGNQEEWVKVVKRGGTRPTARSWMEPGPLVGGKEMERRRVEGVEPMEGGGKGPMGVFCCPADNKVLVLLGMN